MDNGVRKCLTHSFMQGCVIHSLNTLHAEWTWKVEGHFRNHTAKELIQIVLPAPVVSQSVAIALFTYQMAEVNIVHPEVGKSLLYRKPLAKHHQASHRQALFPCFSVNDIAAKILQESLVVHFIPHMSLVPELKHAACLGQHHSCRNAPLVHHHFHPRMSHESSP